MIQLQFSPALLAAAAAAAAAAGTFPLVRASTALLSLACAALGWR